MNFSKILILVAVAMVPTVLAVGNVFDSKNGLVILDSRLADVAFSHASRSDDVRVKKGFQALVKSIDQSKEVRGRDYNGYSQYSVGKQSSKFYKYLKDVMGVQDDTPSLFSSFLPHSHKGTIGTSKSGGRS